MAGLLLSLAHPRAPRSQGAQLITSDILSRIDVQALRRCPVSLFSFIPSLTLPSGGSHEQPHEIVRTRASQPNLQRKFRTVNKSDWSTLRQRGYPLGFALHPSFQQSFRDQPGRIRSCALTAPNFCVDEMAVTSKRTCRIESVVVTGYLHRYRTWARANDDLRRD